MGWTKQQLVEAALEEIGLASYIYDLSPEQLLSAVKRMDAMVSGWNTNGIRIGYPLVSDPDNSLLNTDTGIPDFAAEAIFLGLAIRIAPSYGKSVPIETKANYDLAYNNMCNAVALPVPERQLPGAMPKGQGVKPWRNYNSPFINPSEEGILAGGDGQITFE